MTTADAPTIAGRRRRPLRALPWLVQPLYVPLELVAAAASRAPYPPLDRTISDLGATTCTLVPYPSGPVAVCSPLHGLVNGGFVGFGLLLALGAVLLRPLLPRTRTATAAVVLGVIAGVSSVATGLVPLDRDLTGHAIAATPSLLAMPLVLVLLGRCLAPRRRGAVTTGLGVVSLLGALAFLATAASPTLGGLWERLAFWPLYLWLPVVALTLVGTESGGAPSAEGARR